LSEPAYLYGDPPPRLVEVPAGARQVSPLQPGALALEDLEPGLASAVVVAAPPGTIERRCVLALALRALRPGGSLVALGPKEKGGTRVRRELEGFGCTVEEASRAHQRICRTIAPDAPVGLEEAIAAGAPRRLESLAAWTWPGVFSWDRLDAGTALLLEALPPLAGRGADLGCGLGLLARRVLESPAVEHLDLVEIDRRALAMARRNVEDRRADFHWADVRQGPPLTGLDFVVMNPPFHELGLEHKGLGLEFIRRAERMLRPGGTLWMVANRRLPYEAELAAQFAQAAQRADRGGYKVIEARA
jgi:16S rRNA (guanine1207-N2)-methyltransferase